MNAKSQDIFVGDAMLLNFNERFKSHCRMAQLPPKVLKKLLDGKSAWRKQMVAFFSQFGPKTAGVLIPCMLTADGPKPAQAILFVELGDGCKVDSGTFRYEGPIKRVVKVFWARSKFNMPVVRPIKDTLLRRRLNKQIAAPAAAPTVTKNPLFGHDLNHRLCVNFSVADGLRVFAILDEGFDLQDENLDDEWIHQLMEESLRLRGI